MRPGRTLGLTAFATRGKLIPTRRQTTSTPLEGRYRLGGTRPPPMSQGGPEEIFSIRPLAAFYGM
jgi:hypothetical protein